MAGSIFTLGLLSNMLTSHLDACHLSMTGGPPANICDPIFLLSYPVMVLGVIILVIALFYSFL